MKYPKFTPLGLDYPFALEQRYERILKMIDALWDTPEIEDYFTSLLIDNRGGRQGFPTDVFNDIQCLYTYREAERLRVIADRIESVRELECQGVSFTVEEFIRSVKEGNRQQVDLFVRGGMNARIRDSDGYSLLMIALKQGFSIIANILLTAGAEIEERDPLGFSPLLLACGKQTKGFQELAIRMIRHGANVNVRDPLGWTPLCLAVSLGNVAVVQLLLEHGANIHAKTRRNESAFELARKFHHEEIVTLLTGYHQNLDFLSKAELSLFGAQMAR